MEEMLPSDIEESLEQAERTLRLVGFTTGLAKAAREQAEKMGAKLPVELSGQFEGAPFKIYFENDNKED